MVIAKNLIIIDRSLGVSIYGSFELTGRDGSNTFIIISTDFHTFDDCTVDCLP
ncbi:hypothetical protein QE417_000244 [Mucilaginibacter terrae]|uniref:Uncharacterized protein n=1 Tax=Mucilaginibacter terrae TaxID=1955052 RepID=A0ABU3GN55_9SPHI|nr:hypothetical protein [Mucilaginibacter terrae]